MKKYSFVIAYIILLAIPASIVTFFVSDLININALTIVIMLALLVGGILEVWAVKQGKKDKFYIWEYNNKTTLNLKILGIAVEDLILFLILTPFFCISMWEFVKRYVDLNRIDLKLFIPFSLISICIIYGLVFRITDASNKKKKRK